MNAENCEKLAAENSHAQDHILERHCGSRFDARWHCGWVNSNNHGLEAQASAQIEDVRIDPFQIMLNAKNLPSEEFGVAP
jgi:hypothetical protein